MHPPPPLTPSSSSLFQQGHHFNLLSYVRRKFDSTQMTSDHRPQPDGTYGTRIELAGLLESSYHAVFTDRNNMLLCTKDSHSVLKTLTPFKSAGWRLHRGYDPAIEREVRPPACAAWRQIPLALFQTV